jgi:N6-adenosine-specific RNA methylase IME4
MTQRTPLARLRGFKPIAEIVWLKRYPSGKARIGTGYRVRTMHEPILVCTVGNPQHKPFPSTFDGIAREHSRKPDEFYDLVLSHTPQAIRRADLFSRGPSALRPAKYSGEFHPHDHPKYRSWRPLRTLYVTRAPGPFNP